MKRLIILFTLLFNTLSYGCAMCQASMPQVGVTTVIYDKKDYSKFDVKWKFHKSFTTMLEPYDENENGIFDKKEMVPICQSIIDYIKTLNYVTEVQYVKKDSEFNNKNLKLNITQKGEVSFEDGSLVFKYSFTVPIKLQKDYKISLSYFDKGGNFAFTFDDVILKDYTDYYAITPTYYQAYIYFFKDYKNQIEQIQDREETEAIADIGNIYNKANATTQTNPETGSSPKFSLLEMLRVQLNGLKDRLKVSLQDIKQKDSIASYFWILLFSFLYGVLHAIGPGHGKTLVSSYFMQKEASYFKAFSIASLIGVVHTFSAFMLTMVVYYIIGLMFSSSLIDIEQATTKVSAVIIILIALYLIYQKYKRDYKPKVHFATGSSPLIATKNTNLYKHTSSCGCNACKTTSTELGVILAAGIVPCPGTVTIFLFTLSLGVYFMGFLSALFMSIGMSLIIYITAILTIKVRKKSETNRKLIKFLEYGSLIFILFLGLILFLV